MIKTIYLTCHATSIETTDFAHIWYEETRHLSSQGAAEAKLLARLYKNAGIEKIITSPSRRALETAEIINKSTGIPLEVSEEFEGRNWGPQIAGKDFEEARKWMRSIPQKEIVTAVPPGGESTEQVQQRLIAALHALIKYPEKNIGIITHSSTFRALIPYLKGEVADITKKKSYEGASLSVVEWDGSKFILKIENSLDHLTK